MDGISNRSGVAGVNRVRQSSNANPSNGALATEFGKGFKNMFLGQKLVEVSAMNSKGVL